MHKHMHACHPASSLTCPRFAKGPGTDLHVMFTAYGCREVTEEEEEQYRAARGGDEGEDAGPAGGKTVAMSAAAAL